MRPDIVLLGKALSGGSESFSFLSSLCFFRGCARDAGLEPFESSWRRKRQIDEVD